MGHDRYGDEVEDEPVPEPGSRRRRRRRRERGHAEAEPPGEARGQRRRHSRRRSRAPRTPEERAYRSARRKANARASFYTHLFAYLSTLALLVVTTRSVRAVSIVAIAWGIAIGLHYLGAIVLIDLRQRWIAEELGRNAPPKVDAERRDHAERKVRSLEELSASIAHEIRNPITAAKSLVQQMGEDPTSGENVDYAKVALDELDRVERSISHLLRYARDEELRVETLDVAGVVESALATFRDRLAGAGVRVELDLDAAGFVRGDGDKLRRVVINLVANALDAFEESARPGTLRVSAGENLAGSEAWIRVRDDGPGLDPVVRDKIFDPFYSTKEHGTGLGLALSKKLVEAHGGTLEVDSEPGVGTEFVVAFPRDPDAGRDREAEAPPGREGEPR